jgi:hypothetical protein
MSSFFVFCDNQSSHNKLFIVLVPPSPCKSNLYVPSGLVVTGGTLLLTLESHSGLDWAWWAAKVGTPCVTQTLGFAVSSLLFILSLSYMLSVALRALSVTLVTHSILVIKAFSKTAKRPIWKKATHRSLLLNSI